MSEPAQFEGQPAGTGARIAAFTIDAVLVLIVGIVAGLMSSSLALGLFLGAEAVLALWILQARTGSSPGKAIFGLRVVLDDAPYSPGAGRSFVRGSLVAMGGLVFVVGAWVVQASSAWDREGTRRSWADRAAQTRVIVVPRQPRSGRAGGGAAGATVLHSPTVIAKAWTPPAAHAPVAPAASAPGQIAAWGEPMNQIATAQPVPVEASGATAPPTPHAAVHSPDIEQAPIAAGTDDELLVIFDTGQRVQLPIPSAVNFGRKPAPSLPTDVTVIVDDPDTSVSRTHLRLEYDRTGAWVIDMGSANGTEIIDADGDLHPIASGERTYVDDDARVRMGNRVFTVSRLIGDLT